MLSIFFFAYLSKTGTRHMLKYLLGGLNVNVRVSVLFHRQRASLTHEDHKGYELVFGYGFPGIGVLKVLSSKFVCAGY